MLLLFDIDGTLLQGATGAHREALHAAIRSVHRIDVDALGVSVAPAGRTDGEIVRALLLDAGVAAKQIDDRADDVRAECCRCYAELLSESGDDLSRCVIPGVAELLDWLATLDGVRLALVTGNYEPVARLKLLHAGIGRFFPSGQGGFGSDAEDRAALPGIARRRAGSNGTSHPRQDTIVVGDTPRDIACARADGVGCVAVATGPFAAEALSGADSVARNAAELRAALSAAIS